MTLPVLPPERRADYQTFDVEWRPIGSGSWNSTTTPTTSRIVRLPGDFPDGSYEVRVRGRGIRGTSLYTVPLRFSLRSTGEAAAAGD